MEHSDQNQIQQNPITDLIGRPVKVYVLFKRQILRNTNMSSKPLTQHTNYSTLEELRTCVVQGNPGGLEFWLFFCLIHSALADEKAVGRDEWNIKFKYHGTYRHKFLLSCNERQLKVYYTSTNLQMLFFRATRYRARQRTDDKYEIIISIFGSALFTRNLQNEGPFKKEIGCLFISALSNPF